ncbi:MAG: hypothetical protein MR821_02285, partial [Clostridiales bacterium]|nr:hypothetical protein [Clostridiales bacterium]
SLRDEIPQAGLEPQPAAACGGIRQAKAGNRKERLWRDYAGFPGRQPSVPLLFKRKSSFRAGCEASYD